jgi:hypothetical protein
MACNVHANGHLVLDLSSADMVCRFSIDRHGCQLFSLHRHRS